MTYAEMTTTQHLASLGLSHRPSGDYGFRAIYRGEERVARMDVFGAIFLTEFLEDHGSPAVLA